MSVAQTSNTNQCLLAFAPSNGRSNQTAPSSIQSGHILSDTELRQAGITPPTEDSAFTRKAEAYDARLARNTVDLVAHVEWVERILKEKYVGWDDRITRWMSEIKTMIVRANSNDGINGPLVFPLMTLPGYGKTSIIMDLKELLARHPQLSYLNSAFNHVTIKENTPFLEPSSLEKSGVKYLDPNRPISGILFLDEIQNLVPLNSFTDAACVDLVPKDGKDAGFERRGSALLRSMNVAVGFDVNSMNYGQLADGRRRMTDFFWQMLGNGRAQKSKAVSVAKLYEEVKRLIEDPLFTHSLSWLQQLRQHLETLRSAPESNPATIAEVEKAIMAMTDWTPTTSHFYLQGYVETFLLGQKQSQPLSPYSPGDVRAKLEVIVKAAFRDTPELMDLLRVSSSLEFIELLMKDPPKFLETLQQIQVNLPSVDILDYRRTVIFIAGNPTPAIDDMLKRTQISPESIDPDSLYRLTTGISDRRTVSFFEGLFGDQQAMKSRLRLNDWRMIPPYTSRGWMTLIQRRLKIVEENFSTNLRQLTLNDPPDLDLELHSSVSELLQRSAIDTMGGPRVFFQKASGFLSLVEVNLPLVIKDVPKNHRLWKSNQYEVVREMGTQEDLPPPESPLYEFKKVSLNGKTVLVKHWKKIKLTVMYNSDLNSFDAVEVVPNELDGNFIWFGRNSSGQFAFLEYDKIRAKDPSIGFRVEIGEKSDAASPTTTRKQKAEPSTDRVRTAFFQAARSVVGIANFKSAPKLIEEVRTTADQIISDMWTITEREHLDYWMAEAKMLLAAFAIERTHPHLIRAAQSNLTKTELLMLATDTLDKIVNEIKSRDQFSAFLKDAERQSDQLQDILPKDLANNPVFRYAFQIENAPSDSDRVTHLDPRLNPLKAKILRKLYTEVEATIRNQNELIEAIAAHLLGQGPVEPEVSQTLVSRYFRDSSPSLWNRLLGRHSTDEELIAQVLRNPEGQTIVTPAPGMYRFNYNQGPRPRRSLREWLVDRLSRQ